MKRFRGISVLGLSALLIGLFGVVAVQAAPPAPANFTVAAGQSATVRINVFCLDFGKDFPSGQNIAPGAPADEKLRQALSYAIDKGYDQSAPRQLQLALWYLRDNTFHTNAGENKDRAQEIVDSIANAPAIPAGNGTALADASKNGQVQVTATGVQPLSQGEFYGTAVLEVKNTGTSSLNLTLAPGTTFTASGANFQTLIAYPTGAQSSTGAQATTTAATTTTAAATTAAATTAAATTAPATTAAATTAAATTAAVTTVAATTAVATTTAATTTAPATTTAAATTAAATTAPATTVASAAQGGGVTNLPASGIGGSSSNGEAILPLSLLILALVAMLATTGLLTLKRRRS